MTVQITLDDGAIMPAKAHSADAGYDLHALRGGIVGPAGQDFDTGVHVAIPDGYVGRVVGRSGLNFRDGITCFDGTIDPGYTGSIHVKLYAHAGPRNIRAGDRVAQLLIQRVEQVEMVQVDDLPESERGDSGFGSTGC